MGIFNSIFLGIIEGFTEFLPISSTGHLIVASYFLGMVLIKQVSTRHMKS